MHLDCNYQHELGDPRLEHSPAGKGLGGAGEWQLDMKEQCALTAQKIKHAGHASFDSAQEGKGGDSVPLLW